MIFKNGAILSNFRVKITPFTGSTNPLGGDCYIHLTTEALLFFSTILVTSIFAFAQGVVASSSRELIIVPKEAIISI